MTRVTMLGMSGFVANAEVTGAGVGGTKSGLGPRMAAWREGSEHCSEEGEAEGRELAVGG